MKAFFDGSTLPEFGRELKKFCKKYRQLKGDFEKAKKVLSYDPENLNLVRRISGLGNDVQIPIYKLKKFRSTDFRGKGSRSEFRVIYAYKKKENRIIFMEIYHKSRKRTEDRNRKSKYFREKHSRS
jgi:mRNA-degrading endonuclease RelE of RelBE toxin-antitoxin system